MRFLKLGATLSTSLILALPFYAEGGQRDPASWVNPLIGTSNGGNVFPGAVLPFGMVQFSPETSPFNPKWAIAAPGGYEYSSDKIRGFSLTNVEGWGCGGGSGDIPILPLAEAVGASPSSDFRYAYASHFTHKNELAQAGYYHVALDSGIGVDLTASIHTGSAKFSFPGGTPVNILIRTSDSEAGSSDAHTTVDVAHRTVSGSVTSGNFCGYKDKVDRRSYYTVYFVAEFDQPFLQTGAWQDRQVTAGATKAEGGSGFGQEGYTEKGHGSGVWVGFDPARAREVLVRIGISYVSEANARENLAAENPLGTTFDVLRQKAEVAWNRKLGQIEIEGATEDQRTVFTTALYHASMTPNVYSDANGEYRGMDGKVHHVVGKQRAQYANFSGWDVYRSQLQLLTWLDPSVGSDIAQSLLNQSQQNGGVWDRWTHNSGATHVMNGDPAAPAIADIWAFGGHGFDAGASLRSLVRAADVPTTADLSKSGCPFLCEAQRPGLDQWLKLHYIPVGAPGWGPAADTLEDASADFGISVLADRLSDKAVSRRFLERAQYWRNIWNPNAAPDGGYFENRNADGTWALVQDGKDEAPHPFTPATEDGFVEGTAAQYVWMVPFNVHGLFEAMGGKQRAAARLDAFFYDANGAPAVTKAGPLHAELSNEPSIETPWLYDFAGQPWKTQQLVRQVLNRSWLNAPNGMPGNDDLGEMSSWYLFASLGFYPEIPGRAELVLGSPLFSRIVIHRQAGDITIRAPGAAADKPYVSSLRVNGRSATKTWLPESFATHGGTLDFVLSAIPNKSFGAHDDDQPPSFE